MYITFCGTVLAHEITQEKTEIFRKSLNNIRFSFTIFCAKMFQYSHYTYCLQEESTYVILMVSKHFGLVVSA